MGTTMRSERKMALGMLRIGFLTSSPLWAIIS